MKKPSLKNLTIDLKETTRIHATMATQKSIKITINIDAKTLEKLKTMASRSGIPYQRLLNRTLQESLAGKDNNEDRLERLEKEINLLKRKIAA